MKKTVYQDKERNVYIEANELVLGKNLKLGRDIDIRVKGRFEIGDNGTIGDRFKANAEEIIIGDYFFNVPTDSRGMFIGGGASNFPFSKLKIGHRAVCHTGHINLANPVTIGDDVGLSHDVDLITHGFWASVLEGYPRAFKEIKIGNNVIVGWKTVIMSGVEIADNVVIGAQSTVVKSLTTEKAIYVGSPAKFVKMIETPTPSRQKEILSDIINDFKELMNYYEVDSFTIESELPIIKINNLRINVVDLTYEGEHDAVSDAFRDFVRRYGIRVFAPHGFIFNLKRKL
jgi:acetyltransferase-like isoleucine patch superfamily enzyme